MKLALLVLGGVLLATAAVAQTPPVDEPTYVVKLKQHELSYIAGVLQGQPYRDASPILNSIQLQINEVTPTPKPAEPAKVEPAPAEKK